MVCTPDADLHDFIKRVIAEPALQPQLTIQHQISTPNDVDGSDFLSWQRQLGVDVSPYDGADGDGDAAVDADDLGVWTAHFGESGETSPLTVTIDMTSPLHESLIEATDDVDRLVISSAGAIVTVVYSNSLGQSFNQQFNATALDFAQVRIWAGAGNDVIDLAGLALPAVIYGELSDDLLRGGTQNDGLFGDEGRDLLIKPAFNASKTRQCFFAGAPNLRLQAIDNGRSGRFDFDRELSPGRPTRVAQDHSWLRRDTGVGTAAARWRRRQVGPVEAAESRPVGRLAIITGDR